MHLLLTVSILSLLIISTHSSTYYSGPFGSDDTGTGTQSNPWHSIGKGLKSIGSSDVLYLFPGLYSGPSNVDQTINVYDGIKRIVGASRNSVILSCDKRNGFKIGTDHQSYRTTLSLYNVTMEHCTTAIYSNSDGRVYVSNVTFFNCTTGIQNNGLVFVNNSLFERNGVAIRTFYYKPTDMTHSIVNNSFNFCTYGIELQNVGKSRITIEGNKFYRFTYSAINISNVSVSVLIKNNTMKKDSKTNGPTIEIKYATDVNFIFNNITSGEQALKVLNGSTVKVTSSVFSNNSASAYPGWGGAILMDNSTLNVQDTLFLSNYAGYFGGAIYCISGSGSIIHSKFIRNTCYGKGGPFYCQDKCRLFFNENTYQNNNNDWSSDYCNMNLS